MWKTVKKMKKILLIQLNNIKDDIITLSNLTFGLKWETVNFMIGNCRLLTYNNQHKITVKGMSTEETLHIETYSTKYVSINRSMPCAVGQEITLPTSIDYFYMNMYAIWDGMGYIQDVTLDISIDVYGVDEQGNRFLMNYERYGEWSSQGSYYEDCFDDMCWALADGSKSLSALVKINSPKKYTKIIVRLDYIDEDQMISYEYTPLNFNYIDTSQELERTATDVHLIAWEES